MSDAFISTPLNNRSGNMIFGKNSDREPNEAQAVIRIPAKRHKAKQTHTTYIPVPQVSKTYEMILSKPFHVWGAEMGVNQHGVVIGNEAVYTKIKIPKENTGLTGMDLVRLGLERSKSAEDALLCITGLIEAFGQDAYSGYSPKIKAFSHHNSFLIADRDHSFLLETAGRQWVARKVFGFQAISNGLTIGEEYEYSSQDVIDFARKKGWAKKGGTFNFKNAYSDFFMTRSTQGKQRHKEISKIADEHIRRFDIRSAIQILGHTAVDQTKFNPAVHGPRSISMHASGFSHKIQTTGSMVVELRRNSPPVVWVTGTSSPELSLFKPFYLQGRVLMKGEWEEPGAEVDKTLWWQHERLYRLVINNYRETISLFKEERDKIQEQLLENEAEIVKTYKNDPETLDDLCVQNWFSHKKMVKKWFNQVYATEIKMEGFHPIYRRYWRKQNKKAKIIR